MWAKPRAAPPPSAKPMRGGFGSGRGGAGSGATAGVVGAGVGAGRGAVWQPPSSKAASDRVTTKPRRDEQVAVFMR